VLDLPAGSRSTIVAVSVGDADPADVVGRLRGVGIVGSARDGWLRLSVHVSNHEDDAARLVAALVAI
jgi:selenocysteine lyase/cysteine desulfurase